MMMIIMIEYLLHFVQQGGNRTKCPPAKASNYTTRNNPPMEAMDQYNNQHTTV